MPENASLGIDIGGTKTLCVLLDSKFKVVDEVKFKTHASKGLDRFLKKLTEGLKALTQKGRTANLDLVGIGIGCAGDVDPAKGVIKTAPNILFLEGCPIAKVLQGATHLETVLGNDVQVGLWGEHQAGAAREYRHVLGVFFGTGVGGAVIINGKLYQGASGFGGQVGGLLAQPVGGPDAAQSHGIIDRIGAKSAIAAEAAQMAAKKWAPYLHEHVGTDLSEIGWGTLAKAIEHGDQRIEEMIAARMQVIGIALSNAINFLNPELLILGGGLVDEMPKLVVRELEKALRKHLIPQVGEALEIKRAKLAGRAVAVGAALLAFDHFG
jgi:glucokinase